MEFLNERWNATRLEGPLLSSFYKTIPGCLQGDCLQASCGNVYHLPFYNERCGPRRGQV